VPGTGRRKADAFWIASQAWMLARGQVANTANTANGGQQPVATGGGVRRVRARVRVCPSVGRLDTALPRRCRVVFEVGGNP
jgi:hypothetical protein